MAGECQRSISTMGKIVDGVIVENKELKEKSILTRVSLIVDFIFFTVYGILVIRLLLALFAAKSNGGVVQIFKYGAIPLYLPFTGFLPDLTAELGLTLVFPIVVSIFIYMFIYLVINGLLTTLVKREMNGSVNIPERQFEENSTR